MLQFNPYNFDPMNALININRELSAACLPHLINEAFIGNLYSELVSRLDRESAYFWLLYGRMTEAALLCAGHYADNCEYSAAGDLLVNPRSIHVHYKDCDMPEVKDRHGSISEQFMPQGSCPWVFRKNFSSSMTLHVQEPALLPLMANTLAQSGVFCESYLFSINERMKKIADTMVFLLAWSLDNALELHERLAAESSETRKFVNHNLCRFSPDLFHALGEELYCIERNLPPTGMPGFLKTDS